MQMKIIGHVDADSFYVSCERIRDARLNNKPVAVLGNQGACVIARSYEMKPFKVKVGMPVWEAKMLCPEGIYIKRDFQWYGILSRGMQEMLRKFSDVVEYYSIDESFVDFGDYQHDLACLGRKIQQKIFEMLGLPVSVGLSLTRTLAKTASDKNKPLGITVVNHHNLNDFAQTTKIEDVPGIGRRLAKRLVKLGINSVADYTNSPVEMIKNILHKPGEQLWYELKGKRVFPIRDILPERKMLSRGGSIWGSYKDKNYIWGFIIRNLERFVDVLEKRNLVVNELGLILETTCGRIFAEKEKVFLFTADFSILIRILNRLYHRIFVEGLAYSRVHVVSRSLFAAGGRQLSLFEHYSWQKEKIVNLRREINNKHGPFAVRSGVTAFCPAVFKDETSNFEICDLEGKVCF